MLATLSEVVDLAQPGRVYDGVAAICADSNVVSLWREHHPGRLPAGGAGGAAQGCAEANGVC